MNQQAVLEAANRIMHGDYNKPGGVKALEEDAYLVAAAVVQLLAAPAAAREQTLREALERIAASYSGIADAEVVSIARCPDHGLHGQRDECFVCGGPVEQVAMVPGPALAQVLGWGDFRACSPAQQEQFSALAKLVGLTYLGNPHIRPELFERDAYSQSRADG